jgi:iron complex outermembrane receptor protein
MAKHQRIARPPARCTTRLVALAAGCAAVLAQAAHATDAAPSEEEDLARSYGEQPYVSIATGSKQTLARAPAIASVITADDIRAMGATDLDDVLETVPGLHVARSTQGYSPIYVIRGVNLGFNPQVLMLIDGIPITKLFSGNRGQAWGGMTVENVARVEVIRGPGSALYGADAATGVINIITKTADGIAGTELGARLGSFESRDGWALHGGRWGPVRVDGYLHRGSTNSPRRTIEADAQTGLDALLGTHASLAPGRVHNQRDATDATLHLTLDSWRLRLGWRDRDIVNGAGIASALDPRGATHITTTSADLLYGADHWLPDTSITFTGSFMDFSEKTDATLFPAGANLGLGTFTDGMIGNPYKWERRGIVSGDATYSGLAQHRLRGGVGAEWGDLYRVRETKNFNPDYSPIGSGSRADVTDVSGTIPFLRPHSRQLHYLYAQDEWTFSPDWTLTGGVRHDQYSDFGGTTNPRLALVWDAAYNLTAKLMYGTAFRPPSFSELYAINNPVVSGNPALRPERNKTVEAALSWQADPRLTLGANVFHYRLSDIIRLVNFVYNNTGSMTGNGLEFEATWAASRALKVSGNYSYQYAHDDSTDHDSGNAPHHHAYLRADWRCLPGWALDAQLNAISSQPRVQGDTRAALSSWRTVDLTLRSDTDGPGWRWSASVRNLFDADVREPSPYDGSPTHPFISLPGDFPMAGRSVYLQGSYAF